MTQRNVGFDLIASALIDGSIQFTITLTGLSDIDLEKLSNSMSKAIALTLQDALGMGLADVQERATPEQKNKMN